MAIRYAALTFSLLSALSGGAPGTAQPDAPALRTIHVAGNVYMLQTPAAGGNIGVFIGPEGVLIVDDQFAPLSESIVSAIREISDAEIRKHMCWDP